MFPFFIPKGDPNFNSRPVEQDPAYKRYIEFRNDVRRLRSGAYKNPAVARKEIQRSKNALQPFIVMVIIFLISTFAVLPFLHG